MTMPAPKNKPIRNAQKEAGTVYRGKQTRTGNSFGFRFEHGLFKSHPEFTGEINAQVIAPGQLLVSVAHLVAERTDPVLASFLAFLASEIAKTPQTIKPLERDLASRIDHIVEGVSSADDESLAGEHLL
jgi:hypothetical protein